jgi:hypothetical protein
MPTARVESLLQHAGARKTITVMGLLETTPNSQMKSEQERAIQELPPELARLLLASFKIQPTQTDGRLIHLALICCFDWSSMMSQPVPAQLNYRVPNHQVE